MADTKGGREKQARNEENRQRIRAMKEDLARGDEAEPEDVLKDQEYPLTADALRAEYAEQEVVTDHGTERLEDLLEPAEGETFDSPAEARERLRELAE
jgi:hypothetical protein